MRIQELIELGPKLDPSEIDSFEKRIGFGLPADYQAFLLQTNGGMPPEEAGFFYIEPMDWWNRVNVFYRLRNPQTTATELENVLKWRYEQYPGRFGPSFGKLPIASDPCGNEIYLLLLGPERGSVCFWMHNAGDDEDDKLSSSFGAFFDSIQQKPPET